MSKIKIDVKQSEVTIRIDASDHSSETAEWYSAFVDGEDIHMVHTRGGSNVPDNLWLALRGLLKIGEDEYPICFGQGRSGSNHNWHLCSEDIWARAKNKDAYLNNIFYLIPIESNTFGIKFSKEIDEGIGVDIWAYSGTVDLLPRFDYEGDTLHPFPYKKSDLGSVGKMGRGKVFDSTGINPTHRDLHLQVLNQAASRCFKQKLYKIDRITGSITGDEVEEQKVVEFVINANTKDQKACLMNYGVSHAAHPLCDQSYIYTGYENRGWMKQLAKQCPGIQIKDLVLAGAHDAGMYTLNIDKHCERILLILLELIRNAIQSLPKLIGAVFENKTDMTQENLNIVLGNLSITQKDIAFNQMRIGTRYFDFRPAYDKSWPAEWLEETYQIHSFIPGVNFSMFLKGINKFLEENPNEIAVINVNDQGINEDYYTPLSLDQVTKFLEKYVTKEVGYRVLEEKYVKEFTTFTLSSVVDSGLRMIIIYGNVSKNDSYNGSDYSASLTNPHAVINALNETLKNQGKENLYTVLQLQDTGSAALVRLYNEGRLESKVSWFNDILLSKTGNILQATKPVFDHATYQWLTKKETADGINGQPGFVVLLNDFVDISQAEHAIALTREKYLAKKQ